MSSLEETEEEEIEEQPANMRGRSGAWESLTSSEVERFMQEQRWSDEKKAWATLVPNQDKQFPLLSSIIIIPVFFM